MYRFCKQGMDKWYGIEIDEFDGLEGDVENIEVFVDEGSIVLLCEDPSDIERELGIDMDNIVLVTDEDEDEAP